MTIDLSERKPDIENENLLKEKQNIDPQALSEENVAVSSQSPGERLGQARKRDGLSLDQVGDALKIPPAYVEIIDQNRFSELPGLMFARGYVRSYARLVGLHPDQLIDSFDRFTGDNSHETPRLSEGKDVDIRRQVSPLVSISGVISVTSLFLVVAFSYYYWGSGDQGQDAQDLIVPEAMIEPLIELEFMPADTVPVADSLTDAGSLKDVVDQDKALNIVGQLLPEPDAYEMAQANDAEANTSVESLVEPKAIVAVKPAALVKPTVSTASDSPIKNPGIISQTSLVIDFVQDCWVQIKNMDGKVLFTDVQKAGSNLDLEVPPTIQIRFGNTPGVKKMVFNDELVEVKPSAPGRKVASIVLGSEDAG